MLFRQTQLEGVLLLEPECRTDERGFFARTWCRAEFAQQGLWLDWVQCSLSFNRIRGTLRGLHYQVPPSAEAKLIRCTMGALYDVVVDVRPESTEFGRWIAVELTAHNRRLLYIPEGFAHGFQTLVDDTEVLYQVSEYYCPEAARGVKWNDPLLGIQWPACDKRVISSRDQEFPDLALPVRR
jgi:dTDP-4-dehydrorhamnose 3,5-epimerase